MFVYRHFGRWGFGVGLPTFLFLILPCWIVWEVAKAIVCALVLIVRETYRAIAQVVRERRDVRQ